MFSKVLGGHVERTDRTKARSTGCAESAVWAIDATAFRTNNVVADLVQVVRG
jgi:hypothetical protein